MAGINNPSVLDVATCRTHGRVRFFSLWKATYGIYGFSLFNCWWSSEYIGVTVFNVGVEFTR